MANILYSTAIFLEEAIIDIQKEELLKELGCSIKIWQNLLKDISEKLQNLADLKWSEKEFEKDTKMEKFLSETIDVLALTAGMMSKYLK